MPTALSILINANLRVLKQLQSLAHKLPPEGYARPLDLLSGNTIGKHFRHILEFYQCLLTHQGIVNYDKRLRNTELENDVQIAQRTITEIIEALENNTITDECYYEADFSDDGGQNVKIQTSFSRELAYNIEHTVHHMAIIQIVVKHYYTQIELEEGFGVAASTLRYQHQASCAQ